MGPHLHFALLDNRLLAADRMLGFNDPALVAWLSRMPDFVHGLMNLAYSNTVPVLLGSLILQAWRRERTEIWRSVFCFTGSLLTVCVLSIATPAKGLGLWVSDADLARLPGGAGRYFWPAFNDYYDGTATHIQIDLDWCCRVVPVVPCDHGHDCPRNLAQAEVVVRAGTGMVWRDAPSRCRTWRALCRGPSRWGRNLDRLVCSVPQSRSEDQVRR